ncbi:MAG: hypothetical protein KAJ40_03565 [Alphaproteobacteria bacterium]|nr:hypothetical protein [Alphaproteobacteria bacterium]
MRFIKPVKPIFMITVSGLVLAVVFGAVMLGRVNNVFQNGDNVMNVTLQDFAPGTQVSYRITSDTVILSQEQVQIDGKGSLSLPIDKEMIASVSEASTIKYELDMAGADFANEEEQSPADILRVILALNPQNGKMNVSASGLKDYAEITLKQNDIEEQKLNADWAGLFSAELGDISNQDQNNLGIKEKERINETQLAFQNSGINSDLLHNHMGMPKIDVQIVGKMYGDSDGSSLPAVRSGWSATLIRMTEQFSAVMAQQTMIIGMFFDANIQLETQRKLQELQARAHKDYHPSEQMCRIGTYVRSVAHSQSKAELEKAAINRYLIEEYMGVEDTAAAGGSTVYEEAKVKDYEDNYCDGADNGAAVGAICDVATSSTKAETLERRNKDIDYTRAVESKLTLDLNYTDGTVGDEESDVLALARYLYFSTAFAVPEVSTIKDNIIAHYDSRSYAAKMSVAHNSFVNIIGMKAAAPAILDEDAGWVYMKSMLRNEFSLSDDDILDMMGERPSYYAQMEVLTKKIYQNPNFYVNLYDKPANVKRIGASLDAILLMNMRDRFESLLRREMLSAVLVEHSLQDRVSEINSGMFEEMQRAQIEQ